MTRRTVLDIRYIRQEQTTKEKRTSLQSSQSGEFFHTVVYGDNLWNLAKRYYGSGKKFEIIYNANLQAISELVRKKGKSRHYKGYQIVPGMKLLIPDIRKSSSKKVALSSKKRKKKKVALENLAEIATAFSFEDVADGKSDSISVSVCGIGKDWLGKERPKKGDRISTRIVFQDGKKPFSFSCGDFTVDDVSFSVPPLICQIGAVNVPLSEDFKTLQKTVIWQKTNIKDIAEKIARATKVKIIYDADLIRIEEIEQSNQTDSAFLRGICSRYGLGMKIYKDRIVIFDFAKYEKKKAVFTLLEKDMMSWSANTTVEGTYTGVKFSYNNPVATYTKKGELSKRKKNEKVEVVIGKPGRLLYLNHQAENKGDAGRQAVSALNAANRKLETLRVTMMGGRKIVATQCVKIKGLKSLDGKYFVDEVRHEVGNNGYVMELSLHKVQKPVK